MTMMLLRIKLSATNKEFITTISSKNMTGLMSCFGIIKEVSMSKRL